MLAGTSTRKLTGKADKTCAPPRPEEDRLLKHGETIDTTSTIRRAQGADAAAWAGFQAMKSREHSHYSYG